MALPAAHAEGFAQDQSGSVLEEYLDNLLVLPVEMRRYLTLMRELDEKCARNKAELNRLQAEYLSEAQRKLKEAGRLCKPKDRAALVEDKEALLHIEQLRNITRQMVDEKCSLADQLVDMSEHNIRRLDGDVNRLELILRQSGELDQHGYKPGKLAAGSPDGIEWILVRILAYSPLVPDQCQVADADSPDQRYTLDTALVVPLVDHEDVTSAKERLPTRGREIYAMYPDSTSFYKAVLCAVPHREARGSVSGMDDVVCTVQFDDDEDATGVAPRRTMTTRFVFVPPSNEEY